MLCLEMTINVKHAPADVKRCSTIWGSVSNSSPIDVACALLMASAMICIYKALDVTDTSLILLLFASGLSLALVGSLKVPSLAILSTEPYAFTLRGYLRILKSDQGLKHFWFTFRLTNLWKVNDNKKGVKGSWRTGRGGRPVCGSSSFLFLTDMEFISGVRFESPGEGLTTGLKVPSPNLFGNARTGFVVLGT
jgi:hypothetical protein